MISNAFTDVKALLYGRSVVKRIVHIHNLQDPRGQGNLLAFQSIRIPGAIQFFMVMTNNRQHETEGFKWSADSFPQNRMLLHDAEFLRRQATRLKQNGLRHSDLANIVHDSGSPQSDELLLRQPNFFAQSNRVSGQSFAMTFGVRILAFDAARQSE